MGNLPLDMLELVHVLEKKQEHMEEIRKEFSEFINLTKLNSLFFQDQKIHGKEHENDVRGLLKSSIRI